MFKMVGWTIKIITASIVISFVSMVTTWYTVNFYVSDMMKQLNVNPQAKTMKFTDFVAQLSKHTNGLFSQVPSSYQIPETKQEDNADPGQTSESMIEESKPDDAVAVWNDMSSSGDKAVVMSTEDFRKKKELLSNEDKMNIFSLLVSRLPQEQMQKISTFVEDGITADEMREVQMIVEQHLQPKEYRQLMEILNKY
jgi:hypothetical protein